MHDDLAATWAALAGEVADLRALLAAQSLAAWQRPTRLPGWDVTILVAHLARGVGRVAEYAATPLAEPPARDRRTYWDYDARAAAPEVDARARAAAAGATPAGLLAELDRALTAGAAAVARLAPATVIPSAMGPIQLVEYLPTRLVEVCIHGLDLRDALGAPLRPTPAALARTAALLDQLLGSPRPADLGDPVAFIEAASGRRPHDDPRLPLLG
jgi:uncharacterized protein (TIGR03083 family)